jgi:hypothetical protein
MAHHPIRLPDTVIGGDHPIAHAPPAWLFLGVLLSFVVTRVVTRRIRATKQRDKQGRLIGDIAIGGIHVHHQVFGILIMLLAGGVACVFGPHGSGLDATAGFFGVGVGLAFDEFALWFYMEDVYWTRQGQASVDAVFVILAVTGLLATTTFYVSGGDVTASPWLSYVLGLAVSLSICGINIAKGKLMTAIIGIIIWPVAVICSLRLAKPESWWARHQYRPTSRRLARSRARFGSKYQHRWNRVRDLVAGTPDPG